VSLSMRHDQTANNSKRCIGRSVQIRYIPHTIAGIFCLEDALIRFSATCFVS
jgi:hypothetical protein